MLRVNHLSGFGRTVPAAGGYDSDAQAFFTAAGITDTTQKNAVNQLVLDLKAASIWTKMTALYPFVGGDATKHSYNLKNTGTYQITWSGTVTHDSNGITPNGSTGYGNTGLNALSVLTEDNCHISIYSRSNVSDNNDYDIGAFSGNDQILINPRNGSNLTEFRIIFTAISVSNTNSQGFYIGSRRSQTDFEAYKNGSSIGTSSTNQAGINLPNLNVYIGALNNSGATLFSTRNLALASIGSSLTDTEAANFHTAVETFQDALGRGVV